MPSAGFKPAIPAGERLQAHALDGSATGIGVITDIQNQKYNTQNQEVYTDQQNNT